MAEGAGWLEDLGVVLGLLLGTYGVWWVRWNLRLGLDVLVLLFLGWCISWEVLEVWWGGGEVRDVPGKPPSALRSQRRCCWICTSSVEEGVGDAV